MIMCWFLLLLLVSLSEQDRHQTGVSRCGPQNLQVSRLDQTVLITWEDDASCLALKEPILYKMTVLIEHKEAHSDEVSVPPDDVGSTHSWRWMSPLPLECASHTFRLRSQTNNQTSQLEQETTLHGETGSGREKVFPQDAVLEAGSMGTFCCIVPHGEEFDKMTVNGSKDRNMSTKMISEQKYAVTLQLEPFWDRCVVVGCETKEPTRGPYGSCVYIGYPPDVRDLQCETRDLESVECFWDKGRDTMVEIKSETNYQLDGSPCDSKSKTRCSKKLEVKGGEKNWTLTAWNKLGKVEIQDTADLTRRVYMLPPQGLTAGEVNARNASLSWRWTVQQYNNLSLTCKVNILNKEENLTLMEHGVGLKAAVLSDLTPNWDYEVKVQCKTAQHFWKWGDWSQSFLFRTEGDIPDALDVWMKREKNQTVIVWKTPLDKQSHGDITEYEVTWARTSDLNQMHNTTVPPSIHRYPLCLDTGGEHVATVTARNKHGSSPPSTITIPAIRPDETSVTPNWITGSNGGFDLSWLSSPEASCGYIVDWVPAVRDGPVDWLKLPPTQTSVRMTSKNFTDGWRYSLSIYACTRTSPLLLEKKEGYVTETPIKTNLFKSPPRYEQQGSDVEISWDPVSLREQSAFIRGYLLYYQEESHKVSVVTTDNPEATSLTVKNLKEGSYTFTLGAQTAVGVFCNTSVSATLNFQTDNFFKIFISMLAVFVLLLLITFLCYRHWANIKEKVYPQIPKPDMADWLAAPIKTIHPYLHTEEHMDIPELYYKSGERLNNNTHQEDMAFISSQPPHRYQKDPVQRFDPSALITSDPGIPALSVFPNLTYNLSMPGEDRTPGSEPKLQVRDGYKPHGLADIFTQNQTDQDPIPHVSEYIMVPQTSLSQ